MPELPEVETLRRSLLPLVKNKVCQAVKFFRKDIRFPIPQESLVKGLTYNEVQDISRQGKYLLFHVPEGFMLLHLGMSGRVTLQSTLEPQEKHTHAVFWFSEKTYLHFVDPRRFGSIHGYPYLENTR